MSSQQLQSTSLPIYPETLASSQLYDVINSYWSRDCVAEAGREMPGCVMNVAGVRCHHQAALIRAGYRAPPGEWRHDVPAADSLGSIALFSISCFQGALCEYLWWPGALRYSLYFMLSRSIVRVSIVTGSIIRVLPAYRAARDYLHLIIGLIIKRK